MSLESVRAFLAARAPDVAIVALERNSETMSLSAAWGVKPAQIAKSLALSAGGRNLLLLACGDSRLDNKKVKAAFGGKAKMLSPGEAAASAKQDARISAFMTTSLGGFVFRE